jgi:cytochrome c oxidase cbb3-type subunit III
MNPNFSSQKIRLFTLLCTAALSLYLLNSRIGLTALAQAPASPNTSEGRTLFESSCAGCHGLDGRGSERGPDISTRQQIVQLSDEDILGILRAGRPTAGMPPFAFLGHVKLKALLDYVRTLQGKGQSAALPGNPHNGKSLFFGNARCSECHMVQGAGGFLGRDLSSYGASLSPAEIRSSMLNAGGAANKANKTAVVTLRDGNKLQGVIRNEDNFSLQLQSFDGAFHLLNKSDVAQIDFLLKPIMPDDYASSLKPSELDDLVSFLMTSAKTKRTSNPPDYEEDKQE